MTYPITARGPARPLAATASRTASWLVLLLMAELAMPALLPTAILVERATNLRLVLWRQ